MRLHCFGGLALERDGRSWTGPASQPRRLALLALLARAGDRGLHRDKLLALLWPDVAEDRARRALVQATYSLRQDLGADDMVGGPQLFRLRPDIIASDVGEFVAAMAVRDPAAAVAAYTGPFLDGFALPGMGEFNRWADDARRALAHEYSRALTDLAARAESAGDPAGAAEWWRKLATIDPLDGRAALRLMQALDASGDRAAALRHARIYTTLIAQELDAPADAELLAYAERLRTTARPVAPLDVAPAADVPVADPPPAAAPSDDVPVG